MAVTTSPESSHPGHAAASALVGELYEAHGRMVVGLCRFLLRDRVEAEDAAQQVFVSAQRSVLGGSRPRDAPAWLATIARNECRARMRRRIREPLVHAEPDAQAALDADPFSEAVRSADLEALREGLVRLPPAQRDAFVLREFAGLSYDELARALGVTGKAVESLLVRARTRLRLVLTRANPLVVPIALRDQIVRLAAGTDEGSTGAIAKIASLPFAAKLAAAGAGVALVAGGGPVLEGRLPSGQDALSRKAIGASHARAASAQSAARARARVVPVARKTRPVIEHRGSEPRSGRRASVTRIAVEHEHHAGETYRAQAQKPEPVTTRAASAPSPGDETPPADVSVTAGFSSGPGPAPETGDAGTSGPGSGAPEPSVSASGPGAGEHAATLEASSSSGSGSGDSGSGDSSGGEGASSGSDPSGSGPE